MTSRSGQESQEDALEGCVQKLVVCQRRSVHLFWAGLGGGAEIDKHARGRGGGVEGQEKGTITPWSSHADTGDEVEVELER